MSNMIFIFTPTKLKSKINFVALRIKKNLHFIVTNFQLRRKSPNYTHDHILHKSAVAARHVLNVGGRHTTFSIFAHYFPSLTWHNIH